MGNCLVTKLKGSADIKYPTYLDYGVLFFDNTIVPTQSSQSNMIHVVDGNFLNLDGLTYTTYNNNLQVSLSTPANTFGKILYKLSTVTEISGVFTNLSNYQYSLTDVLRCTSLKVFAFPVATNIENDYDFESLSSIKTIERIEIFDQVGAKEWYGDVVNFTNKYIANGLTIGAGESKIIVIRGNTITTNGIKYTGATDFMHVVIEQDAYNIYRTTSRTPLASYSGLTPVYTKELL